MVCCVPICEPGGDWVPRVRGLAPGVWRRARVPGSGGRASGLKRASGGLNPYVLSPTFDRVKLLYDGGYRFPERC